MAVPLVPGSINLTRYVNITSGIGGGTVVAQRQLVGRIFTDNPLVPPQTYVQFAGGPIEALASIAAYFGTGSEEYLRAQFYFSYVSKNITSPQILSYGRWVDTAQAAVIFGKSAPYSLNTFTAVTAGSINLTLGASTHQLTGINLSSAGSLTAVAAAMQTAIRAYSSGGADWTAATVAWDSATSQFNFTGGVAGPEILAVLTATAGTDLAPLLGWTSGAIVGQGSAVETLTQCLTTSANISNNFGSFIFMPALDTTQDEEVAAWTDSQNVSYMFLVPVTSSNYAAIYAGIQGFGGCGMTLTPISGQYAEMVPMCVLAATDYTQPNAAPNYMFQNGFALTPSVTTDLDANTYDASLVNYYGQTQSAGQYLQFYQRGVLTGSATDPQDMNIYANEMWLKSAASAQLMSLLLSVAEVSANTMGQSQLLAILQAVIDQALFNGTISVGKPLSATQKLFITQASGDPKAWYQVQTIGYWLNCVLQSYTDPNSGLTQWKALYTLIYSKNDAIRLVNGTDVLI